MNSSDLVIKIWSSLGQISKFKLGDQLMERRNQRGIIWEFGKYSWLFIDLGYKE